MTHSPAPWPTDVPAPAYAPPHEPREHRPAFRSAHDSRSIVLLVGLDAAARLMVEGQELLMDVCALAVKAIALAGRERDDARMAAWAEVMGELDAAGAKVAAAKSEAAVNERVAERFAERALDAEARIEAARVALVRLEALAARGGSAEGREAVRGMREALG